MKEFHCISQPPPKESCNGDLLGYIVTWSEHSSSTSGVNQSKSLTVNGWATTKVQLTGLRKFTKYDISIRAFNSIASGPASVPIVGTTQEGGAININFLQEHLLFTDTIISPSNETFANLLYYDYLSAGNSTDASIMHSSVFPKC